MSHKTSAVYCSVHAERKREIKDGWNQLRYEDLHFRRGKKDPQEKSVTREGGVLN